MKLAKFLANYLDDMETAGAYGVTGDVGDLEETIQAGLEAFASAEDVRIDIKNPIAIYYKEQIG